MTTRITTNATDSQMHNIIMATGSKEHPPMLAPGRYAQWRSHFMRYIVTKPNSEALKKCITKVTDKTLIEDLTNMSIANKAHYQAEKEAIHMLLTGIGDEIYSTVDACKTAHKMWIAIERLQQGKSRNIQDVKTNLFWEFGLFTLRDGELMESYYSKFYKMMNKMKEELDTLSYHKLFDILKRYQKEANEIRAEKIARNANPLVLIAKPITPPSESTFEKDSDPEQAKKDKEMQKNLALIAKYFKKLYKPTNNNLITSSNYRNKNVDTTPRYVNENQTGQFGNQRTVTVTGAKETVGSQFHGKDSGECNDERAALANLIANLTIDNEENKKILKQLKKASLTQELKEYKTTRALGELNSTRDSCLIAFENQKIEIKKYKTYLNRKTEYDTLEHKLKETQTELAQKENDIQDGLKLKAYEIYVVKKEHDELVK
ncbi:hypothetical protein Tco_1031991 [Tanacetum coccineum]|uniref:Uncharacterized protein n=1 Tax=Tanacetum coccineum TaxID=301880 RepID=A0ABQ5GC16_9ASTR